MAIWYTLGVAFFAAIGTFLFVSLYLLLNHMAGLILMRQ